MRECSNNDPVLSTLPISFAVCARIWKRSNKLNANYIFQNHYIQNVDAVHKNLVCHIGNLFICFIQCENGSTGCTLFQMFIDPYRWLIINAFSCSYLL